MVQGGRWCTAICTEWTRRVEIVLSITSQYALARVSNYAHCFILPDRQDICTANRSWPECCTLFTTVDHTDSRDRFTTAVVYRQIEQSGVLIIADILYLKPEYVSRGGLNATRSFLKRRPKLKRPWIHFTVLTSLEMSVLCTAVRCRRRPRRPTHCFIAGTNSSTISAAVTKKSSTGQQMNSETASVASSGI